MSRVREGEGGTTFEECFDLCESFAGSVFTLTGAAVEVGPKLDGFEQKWPVRPGELSGSKEFLNECVPRVARGARKSGRAERLSEFEGDGLVFPTL